MLSQFVTACFFEIPNWNLKNKKNFIKYLNCFQLSEFEHNSLRSQISTLKNYKRGEHKKYLPYVFKEQGIIMLAGLLKSEVAVQVSIRITDAFVEMRKFINENTQVFRELSEVKYKIAEHDKKFDQVFDLLQHEENIKQRIFFEG